MVRKESLFRNKNFTLTFFGALVSNVASMFYSFAIGFYILDLSNNNAMLQGVFLGMCGIVFGVVTLFGGVLADKYNRAKIMFLTDYIKGFLIILIAFLLLLFKNNVVQIVLLFIMGFCSNAISGFFSPAATALLPVIVEKDRLQEANSYGAVLRSFQSIVGAILAAILYAIVDMFVMFLIVGVLYVASAISEMFIKYNFVPNEEKLTIKNTLFDLKDGAKYIFEMKPVFYLIIIVLFINFFIAPPFSNFLPFFIKTDLANSDYMFMEILTPESLNSISGILEGLGMILIGLIISKKDYTGKAHKCLIFALGGLALSLVGVAISYYVFVKNGNNMNNMLIVLLVVFLLSGILCGYTNIPVSTAVQRLTAEDKLGKVSACMDVGCQALVPLSSFVAGAILNYFGSSVLLVFCSCGFVVATIICIFNKKIRSI